MNELVDLYDSAIKALKASSEIISEIEKTQKFKEILGPYLELLKGWSQYTVGENSFKLHLLWPLNTYIQRIESIFLQLSNTDPNQLMPSGQFSVNAAVLGSGTDFKRHLPETLEDVFTLIHQNLLASTATLTKELFSSEQIQNSLLPVIIKNAINSAGKMHYTPQFIGMEVDQKGITFHYNVPLSSHSGKFSLYYDRKTEKLNMEAQFLGPARERWEQGLERVIILDAAGLMPLQSKAKLASNELIFNWDISNPEYLNTAYQEYEEQCWLSFSSVIDEDVQNFATEVLSFGNTNGLFNYLSNPTITPFYGKKISELLIDQFLQQPIDTINPEIFLATMRYSNHPFAKVFLDSLLVEITGQYGVGGKKKPPENYKLLIEQLLKNFKSDPTILRFLLFSDREIPIWRSLISQDKCFSEAFFAIQQGLQSVSSSIRTGALYILSEIVGKGSEEGISMTIATLQRGSRDSDFNVKEMSDSLWIPLVEKHKGISEVRLAAQKFIDENLHADNQKNRIKTLKQKLG